MVTEDSTCGTDKLTATLNSYIGKIVDCTFVSNYLETFPFTIDGYWQSLCAP